MSDADEDLRVHGLSGLYRNAKKIGEGAFSVVYRAEPVGGKANEYVALKCIFPTCLPARVISEVRALETLGGQHGCMQLLRVHCIGDRVTLVLPYFESTDFKQLTRTLTLPQVALFMRILFGALRHMHGLGLIHRDVKPRNFLFSPGCVGSPSLESPTPRPPLAPSAPSASSAKTDSAPQLPPAPVPETGSAPGAGAGSGQLIDFGLCQSSDEWEPIVHRVERLRGESCAGRVAATPTTARRDGGEDGRGGGNRCSGDAEARNRRHLRQGRKRGFDVVVSGADADADADASVTKMKDTAAEANRASAGGGAATTTGTHTPTTTATIVAAATATASTGTARGTRGRRGRNVLLGGPCRVGSSFLDSGADRAMGSTTAKRLRPRVRVARAGTAGYRAPEVLLQCPDQTPKIDVWAAGVILLSLLARRYPIFDVPDRHDMTALMQIAQLTGADALCAAAEACGKSIVRFPPDLRRERVCWREFCGIAEAGAGEDGSGAVGSSCTYTNAFNFLDRCLDPNPYTRITAAEALRHDFLKI